MTQNNGVNSFATRWCGSAGIFSGLKRKNGISNPFLLFLYYRVCNRRSVYIELI